MCETDRGTVAVSGRGIRRVDFRLDGKLVARVTKRDRSGMYRLRVRLTRPGAVRVTARVVFTKASGARARTLRLSMRVCRVASVRPSFTG